MLRLFSGSGKKPETVVSPKAKEALRTILLRTAGAFVSESLVQIDGDLSQDEIAQLLDSGKALYASFRPTLAEAAETTKTKAVAGAQVGFKALGALRCGTLKLAFCTPIAQKKARTYLAPFFFAPAREVMPALFARTKAMIVEHRSAMASPKVPELLLNLLSQCEAFLPVAAAANDEKAELEAAKGFALSVLSTAQKDLPALREQIDALPSGEKILGFFETLLIEPDSPKQAAALCSLLKKAAKTVTP